METAIRTTKNTTKRPYDAPQIGRVMLDNQISLILASDASPAGEPEGWSKVNDNKNPFKTTIG
jgi:hypothetical protein